MTTSRPTYFFVDQENLIANLAQLDYRSIIIIDVGIPGFGSLRRAAD